MIMHLKEIHLENFKSFGRSVTIPFLEGYTAITGPNGSGKSNICDAVLFVLGPKSPKAIRAGRLTDLIFKGGKDKKSAKYCKVGLVFDNKDRTIPIDTDTVSLTRLVKFSPTLAENYYSYFYVNGKSSSLSEFENLLAHARISADGYNIVQQGDINRITGMTNVERRKIIDDVAGITKFDSDIEKAETKKKAVEENLNTIRVLLEEIKRQLSGLEKEKDDALKYKEIEEKLNKAKAQMAHKKKDAIVTDINNTNLQIKNTEIEITEYEKKQDELSGKLKEIEDKLKETDNKIAELSGDDAKQLKEKIDALRLELARATAGISSSEDNISKLKMDKGKAINDIKNVEKELTKYLSNKEKTETDLSNKKRELEEKNKEYNRLVDVATKSNVSIGMLQRDVLKIKKEIDEKELEIHKLTLNEDNFAKNQQSLQEQLGLLEEEKNKLEFEVKDTRWRLSELKKETKGAGSNLKVKQEELFKLVNREKELSKEANRVEEVIVLLNRDYGKLNAEKSFADNMRHGYDSAVKAISDARNKGLLKGIHGTAAELATIDKKFENALTVAAGRRMQSIVVDNDESAAKAISYLKQGKYGRATFLPLNKMVPSKPSGKSLMVVRSPNSYGFAMELIKFDEKYKSVFWYVFGDTIVVEDLNTARSLMGGVRLVTLDGDLVETSGAMTGGVLEKGLPKFGVQVQNELDRIGADLRKNIELKERLNEELKTITGKRKVLESELVGVGSKEATQKSEIELHENRIKDITALLENNKKRYGEIKKELEENEKNHIGNITRIDEITENIKKLSSEKEEKERSISDATSKELGTKIEKIRGSLTEGEKKVMELESSFQTILSQIKLYEERRNEISERLKKIENDVEENSEKIEVSKKTKDRCNKELDALVVVDTTMNKELNKLQNKRNEMYKEKVGLESQKDNNRTQIETKGDFIITLQSKLTALGDKLKEIEEELKLYNVEISEKLPSMEHLKDTIFECESAIKSIGQVNMLAIEKYNTEHKRKEEFETELAKLENQKQDLVNLVDEAKKKKKEGFYKVFDAVNSNFKSIYEELSGGGTAELLIENQEMPFEGGLIIKATPKGKKSMRLEALSGGEKSLTALALIFSIQQYAPSPFYVLDEVDMFLDAVNAENIGRMIKKYSRSAQFVEISLRKVTLKEAEHVYGITMQKEGVSEIVGNVNIKDIKDVDAATATVTVEKTVGEIGKVKVGTSRVVNTTEFTELGDGR
jgi:chromosome segregation protein